MNCDGCFHKKPMSKLTVKGEDWGEKWLCDKCVKDWDEETGTLKKKPKKKRRSFLS